MDNTEYRPVSVGEWMLTQFLMIIPIVNFILLLVWAFGGGAPASKSNWAKATLIWGLIAIVFYVLLLVTFGIGAVALARH